MQQVSRALRLLFLSNVLGFLEQYRGEQSMVRPSRMEMCGLLAPSYQNPFFDPYFIGMEPKDDGLHPVRGTTPDGRFHPRPLEIFSLGSPEAGTRVGPFFERIQKRAQIQRDTMFDFSQCVLNSSTYASTGYKWCFVSAARECLRVMKLGPCVFTTCSRNMQSWVEQEKACCADPDFCGRPSWSSWTGIIPTNAEGEVYHKNAYILASYPGPVDDVIELEFSRFGFTHYLLCVPNPCLHQGGMHVIEEKVVRRLRQLCWGK